MTWIGFGVRVVAGGVLAYAGLLKAVSPAPEFAAVIEAYRMVPASWALPLARTLPWIELWVGTFLIAGYWVRRSAAAAAVLYTAFIAAVGSALVRGIDLISCGCFGADAMSPRVTLFMDAVLLALTFLLIAWARRPQRWAVDNWIDRPS